jgi:hypothetical protein
VPNYPDSDRALDQALSSASPPGATTLRQTLILERDWLPTPDTLALDASYHITTDEYGQRVLATLGPHELYLDEPIRLASVCVPKPWGQEIWLTGIEARGESGVQTGAGVLPLSQYLALAPRRLASGAPLVLLKVLDPSPQPVLGDLYFEAHQEKQEVYVVSHVDPDAWPDGRGAIRFGMNPALRRRYGDDEVFRRDYLAAVKHYHAVRQAIDAGAAVAPGEEAQRRSAMEAFTHLRELAVGDVVVVPTWLPHSLQHGVRVIEFQTPSYERYIISFAQKVLTQDHWDSEAAVARMRLDAPGPPCFEALADGVERIVAFDDFGVWRITLEARQDFTLPDHASYGLCMVVQGRVTLGPLALAAEEAAFVPAAALTPAHRDRAARLVNCGEDRATVLLAAPEL